MPVILLVHFISLRKIERKAMLFANYKAMEKVFGRKILSKNYPLLVSRVLTLIFIIFAVSGTVLVYESMAADSDFVLAIDASASMLAQDYEPTRIAAAREAAKIFVDSVPDGTRAGVISFAGTSFVQHELTDDHDKVRAAIDGVDIELVGGTAIGEAIVSGTNMLVSSGKSRVIVLLTDGQNNIGVSVDEAIAYAKRFGVAVHTIGIGTEAGGTVMNTSIVVGLDSATLERISRETGGVFYRAESGAELDTAFSEIASESRVETTMPLSSTLMLIALALFLVELVLVNSKYRTIP